MEGSDIDELLSLAAANHGAIYVVGKTPTKVIHMGGRSLWMSFLVVDYLDNSDQFILQRDFVRNFDMMIDLNNGLMRTRNQTGSMLSDQ